MYNELLTSGVPIRSWCPHPDTLAQSQILQLSHLPYVFGHIALMPDAHAGVGVPIGTVFATENALVPCAVGQDIGCGMCAIKTNLRTDRLTHALIRDKLLMEIRRRIPMGSNRHRKPQQEELMPSPDFLDQLTVCRTHYAFALTQLGTLGGGNHFIEFERDDEGWVWIMLHSGSRNLGVEIARYYHAKACEFSDKSGIELDPERKLAFLPVDSEPGRTYLQEMRYGMAYAFQNRSTMIDRIIETLSLYIPEVLIENRIDIPHNYVTQEVHFGKEVWVHRKGAIRAGKGEAGIIPGSQGSCSYLTEGLGNAMSFESSSHGAGRRMSRSDARKNLDLRNEIERLKRNGVIHSIHRQKDLDEAAGAYKDIETVMENQVDLTRVVTRLYPMAVLKG